MMMATPGIMESRSRKNIQRFMVVLLKLASCCSWLLLSTSKNESVDRLVLTYLSNVESEITMRDSRRSLTDRQISDSASPSSDIAGFLCIADRGAIQLRRVEINPYNSQV